MHVAHAVTLRRYVRRVARPQFRQIIHGAVMTIVDAYVKVDSVDHYGRKDVSTKVEKTVAKFAITPKKKVRMICVKCEEETKGPFVLRCGDNSQMPFVGELRICNPCVRKYSQQYHLANEGYEWMLEGGHFAIGNLNYTPTEEEMNNIGEYYREYVENCFVGWANYIDEQEKESR